MKEKTKYRIITITCLVGIAIGLYYLLGGFDTPEIYLSESKQRTVIGRAYLLRDDHKYFRQQMDSAYDWLKEGKLNGMLTAVVYEDGAHTDSVRYFLGASTDTESGIMKVPAGFDYRVFEARRVYQLFITKATWIRPTPDQVEDMMQARALKEGDSLQAFTFERYFEDGTFCVEKWVK